MAKSESVELLKERIDYLQQSLPSICRDQLLWRGCSQMQCGVVRPHVVTKDASVYVGGGNSGSMEFTRTIMKYETVTSEWSQLPITAYYTFSMALVKGRVTVIGGCSVLTACNTNQLTSYDEDSKKWCVKCPPMPTKRCATSAVSTGTHVVVVGGITDSDDGYLDTVELLDMSSDEWSVVCPFPMPVTFMSITACNLTGRIYLLGGLSQGGAVKSIISCTLPDLVASKSAKPEKDSVWRTLTNSPYFRSGGAAVNGKLVIASGLDESGDVTTMLHCFDPETEKWSELGEMPSARSSCSIAVLPGSQVLIVGGYYKPKNWVGSLTKDTMATVNLNVP